ncbi:MAG: hypothetical protein VKJ46_11615 [Leptolyngbyaceae bacterium]|nr:hypothetical protein [Leptolyngbyaceae bacterium]
MQLPEPEIEHFYRLYKPLLVYVNQKFDITPGIKTPEDIEGYPMTETNKVREKLYKQPELIDEFLQQNNNGLSDDDAAIVYGWKGFIKAEFWIFRYLKKYTVFLTIDEPCKAYGVLGLYSSFPEMLGNTLPRLVGAVLLPFKGQIIYDGMLTGPNVLFGRSFRANLNEEYEKAKARFGIITSLEVPLEELETDEVAKLKTYLKSARSRELNGAEIQTLISKSSALKELYYQEMGKVYAKKYGQRLREIGLNNVWIALFEEMVIATDKTKEGVEKILTSILPAPQRPFVYIYHLKGK